MKQTRHNFWLNVTIFAALLITTATGFGLWILVPRHLDIVFLGISRNAWAEIHIASGVAGLAGIVAHIVRHWDWLKALRGQRINGLPRQLRANRIVNRIMWFSYIATNVFGASAWALGIGNGISAVRVPDRLHAMSAVAWTILAALHLALHWKWIAFNTRRWLAPALG